MTFETPFAEVFPLARVHPCVYTDPLYVVRTNSPFTTVAKKTQETQTSLETTGQNSILDVQREEVNKLSQTLIVPRCI